MSKRESGSRHEDLRGEIRRLRKALAQAHRQIERLDGQRDWGFLADESDLEIRTDTGDRFLTSPSHNGKGENPARSGGSVFVEDSCPRCSAVLMKISMGGAALLRRCPNETCKYKRKEIVRE